MKRLGMNIKQFELFNSILGKLFPEVTIELKKTGLVSITNETESLEIHWIEFMMHILDKIFYPNGLCQRDTHIKVQNVLFKFFLFTVENDERKNQHPVDILNELVKNIKYE